MFGNLLYEIITSYKSFFACAPPGMFIHPGVSSSPGRTTLSFLKFYTYTRFVVALRQFENFEFFIEAVCSRVSCAHSCCHDV